jgi:hypothetical protein
VPTEITEVSNTGMRPIEEPEFHRLIGRYIRRQFCAVGIPVRAPAREAICDDPLRQGSVTTGQASSSPNKQKRSRDHSAVVAGTIRSTIVHGHNN